MFGPRSQARVRADDPVLGQGLPEFPASPGSGPSTTGKAKDSVRIGHGQPRVLAAHHHGPSVKSGASSEDARRSPPRRPAASRACWPERLSWHRRDIPGSALVRPRQAQSWRHGPPSTCSVGRSTTSNTGSRLARPRRVSRQEGDGWPVHRTKAPPPGPSTVVLPSASVCAHQRAPSPAAGMAYRRGGSGGTTRDNTGRAGGVDAGFSAKRRRISSMARSNWASTPAA